MPKPAFILCLLLTALPTLLPSAPARAADTHVEGRQVSIGQADVQAFLQSRFPVRYAPLGPMLALDLSGPRLTLPTGGRLHLALDLAVSTGAAPVHLGRAELSSALRYESASQAFHLDQPRLEAFDPASGVGDLDPSGRALLDAWLADYAREEPLYRIDPAVAAMLGGVQVQAVAVDKGRLVLTLDRDLSGLAPAAAGGD